MRVQKGYAITLLVQFIAIVVLFTGGFIPAASNRQTNPAFSNELQSTPSNGAEPNQVSDPNDMMAQWKHPRTEERIQDREKMVSLIKNLYRLDEPKILKAMLGVPRHWFVPESYQSDAYRDSPLPIGHGQTISQPFIVAYMTSLLEVQPDHRVLEIGTGSGYQAAVLSEFTPYVYTIEIVRPLGEMAEKVLGDKGYTTVKTKIGDGYKGWPEYAPFDAIIVTCAPDHIPPDLIEQLRPGGKMIIPVGGAYQIQYLMLVTKDSQGNISKEKKIPVRFVPLTRDKETK